MQPLAQRASRVTRSRSETLERLLAFFRPAERADEYPGMPQIRRDLDMCHGDKTDSWVLDLAFEDLAQLNSQLFFDAIDSSALHSCYTISMLP